MNLQRKTYPDDHWLRSHDPEKALAAYLDQQHKAYSLAKNTFIRELLGDLKGKRFLDYGCGAGMFTVLAALEGASEVVGVDAEDTALSTAVHFARQEGVHHLCSFIHSEEFPSFSCRDRFDVILMKDVIEHVPDDQGLLGEAAASVVPGGRIVLSTQNSLSLNYLIQGTYHRVFARKQGMVRLGRNTFAVLHANESAQKIASCRLSERSMEIGLFDPLQAATVAFF